MQYTYFQEVIEFIHREALFGSEGLLQRLYSSGRYDSVLGGVYSKRSSSEIPSDPVVVSQSRRWEYMASSNLLLVGADS